MIIQQRQCSGTTQSCKLWSYYPNIYPGKLSKTSELQPEGAATSTVAAGGLCSVPDVSNTHHHHHHHLSVMELGHLLTRSSLVVSSKVCHDSFYQLGSSVSVTWVVGCEAFCLHVVSSSSCITSYMSLKHSDFCILRSIHKTSVQWFSCC